MDEAKCDVKRLLEVCEETKAAIETAISAGGTSAAWRRHVIPMLGILNQAIREMKREGADA